MRTAGLFDGECLQENLTLLPTSMTAHELSSGRIEIECLLLFRCCLPLNYAIDHRS